MLGRDQRKIGEVAWAKVPALATAGPGPISLATLTWRWIPVTTRELVLNEIDQTPEPLLPEILDFVQFLKTKALKPGIETARVSEPALGKDWLRPEEDEAWLTL